MNNKNVYRLSHLSTQLLFIMLCSTVEANVFGSSKSPYCPRKSAFLPLVKTCQIILSACPLDTVPPIILLEAATGLESLQ